MADDKPILLVEDNADDIFLMRRALKVAGVSNPLFIVNDGEEAVDYLAGNGRYGDRTAYPLPALMFLDLQLPLKSGHEVLEWTRRRKGLETLVIIVLTSSEEPGDIARAYQMGANSYLVKPPTANELAEMATAFNLYWFRHNRFEGASQT